MLVLVVSVDISFSFFVYRRGGLMLFSFANGSLRSVRDFFTGRVVVGMFGQVFNSQQLARPEFLKRAHPSLVDLAYRYNIERVYSLSACFPCVHQLGLAKHFEMFHHPETGEVRKDFHDFRGCPGAIPKEIQNRAPGRIGECFPYRVERVLWASSGCPHVVTRCPFLCPRGCVTSRSRRPCDVAGQSCRRLGAAGLLDSLWG